MKVINETLKKKRRVERVIQFGEGGFLRGFVDWMLQKCNEAGLFDGSAVVVQPIEQGMCELLSQQDCMYTHVMRGMEHNSPTVHCDVVDVISRCIDPYRDFDAYLALAQQPELRVIVSNTTEAGITYRHEDRPQMRPPVSYPAKLTLLLYERYRLGLPGFILLPCELIDQNGKKLRETVLRYAEEWELDEEFTSWLLHENHFCSTLVDRIVTGYPREENLGLPYLDRMMDTSEIFHLWVIEGDEHLSHEFPLADAGLNVIWTDHLEPYRTRKVRILNGAHTALVPYAMLQGFETVKDCVEDPELNAYLKRCIFDEIIPTLDLPEKELVSYANDVLQRFSNPYLKHYLSSIALNSVSKFKVRVLPSILEYWRRFQTYPPTLIRSLSALLKFYKTDMANDDPEIMAFLKTASTAEALARADFWGQDLSFLYDEVKKYDENTSN